MKKSTIKKLLGDVKIEKPKTHFIHIEPFLDKKVDNILKGTVKEFELYADKVAKKGDKAKMIDLVVIQKVYNILFKNI